MDRLYSWSLSTQAWDGVRHHTGAGLHVELTILNHCSSNRNRGVHVAVPRQIANGTAEDAAFSGSSSSMISRARTLGAPLKVPTGRVARNVHRGDLVVHLTINV